MLTQRDKIKRLAIQSKSSELFASYKKLRNQIVAMCKKAKKDYYSNLIAEGCANPNQLWKSIKKLLPSKNSGSTTMLQDDLGTHTEPIDIANSFNRFFSNIGNILVSKFPTGILISNPYPDFDSSFGFKEISVEYVHHALKTVKSSKATGIDNINARLLKDAADIVATPLAYIMNHSLKTGIVPTAWKKARVAPIYKSDNPISPNNYRPISVLPVCMKIFERAVQKQLVSHLTSHGILCKQQSGFRQKHSTHTQGPCLP